MRTRPTLPEGHGELLTQPDASQWPGLIAANLRAGAAWEFEVGGVAAHVMRDLTRREALARAEEFSLRLGVPVMRAAGPESPIVMTGHQPELYHPGIWVKCFLLQQFASETGASAVDLVVDSDGFETLAVTSPCMMPEVTRCKQYLALGAEGECYATAPVPAQGAIDDFTTGVADALHTLSAPSIARHFEEFAASLRTAARDATNLAETITFARRRYEAAARTDYLELPVTVLSGSEAHSRFIVDIAQDAERFASAHNAELDEYRARSGARSAAQPFPNLRTDGAAIELPFWLIAQGRRSALWARREDSGLVLAADGEDVLTLAADPDRAVAALMASGILVVPKALALTMFVRLFACDLFIHGVGGGRYDRVTDGVIRRYFGVEAPQFAVASMTLYLPLGFHAVSDDEVSRATERLNRFDHNPDELLGEVDFETPEERDAGTALAAQKAELVAAIADPAADKKALGAQIRDTNAQLAALLEPVRRQLAKELDSLTAQRDASQVLTDRGYPFCFWDPCEVADKVR